MGLENLQFILHAGEVLPQDLAVYFLSMGVEILTMYLQSECLVISSTEIGKLSFTDSGRIFGNRKVFINEPDENGVGEVIVGGRGILNGYLNDQENSDKVFFGEHFVHTTDLGIMTEKGCLKIIGKVVAYT